MIRAATLTGLLGAMACNAGVYRLEPIAPEALAQRIHPVGEVDRVTFLVFGDSGTGTYRQHRIAEAMYTACEMRACRFALALGDNIYESGVTGAEDPQFIAKFEEPYSRFDDFDIWMVLGNHDWRGDAQAQVDFTLVSNAWRMPNSTYAVPGLPAWLTLIAIDTQTVGRHPNLEDEQERFARAGLCGATGWRLLFGHHPAYSSGLHGDNGAVQQLVDPLMAACDGHVYFSGHDHHLERFDTGTYVQIVSGAAAKLRDVDPIDTPGHFAASEFGFAMVEATPTSLQIDFYDPDLNIVDSRRLPSAAGTSVRGTAPPLRRVP